jgi:hypothetical protein
MAENENTKAENTAGQTGEASCKVEKCKQEVRAKGLCRKHFLGWRRGKIGTKQRYKICSKEACRKKAVHAGRCDEHQKNAKAEGAAA